MTEKRTLQEMYLLLITVHYLSNKRRPNGGRHPIPRIIRIYHDETEDGIWLAPNKVTYLDR